MSEPATRIALRVVLMAMGALSLSLPASAANPPPTEVRAPKLVIDLKSGAKDESGEQGAVVFNADKLRIDLSANQTHESGEQGAIAFNADRLTIDLGAGQTHESGEQGALAFTASKLVIDLSKP